MDLKQLQRKQVNRILDKEGSASQSQRHAAFDNTSLTGPLKILIDKIANYSYKVTDEDITAVKDSGLSEDQIFELIICAAIGQSSRQYDAGIAALDAAIGKEKK